MSAYAARHQRQLGRGTPVPGRTRGSRDCGPRAVQAGIDAVTLGTLVPHIDEIRRRMGKPGPQSTSTWDAERCVESYDTEMVKVSRLKLNYVRLQGKQHADVLADAVKRGDYVHLAIDYGELNRAMHGKTGDPNFKGGHSVGVQGWRKLANGTIQWRLMDPLADGRRPGIPQGWQWVRKSALERAWLAFGAYFGVIRGGERV